jgi:hypothetical protein
LDDNQALIVNRSETESHIALFDHFWDSPAAMTDHLARIGDLQRRQSRSL